jgi:hypothetical protein
MNGLPSSALEADAPGGRDGSTKKKEETYPTTSGGRLGVHELLPTTIHG